VELPDVSGTDPAGELLIDAPVLLSAQYHAP
jgi:hypothetical protein